MQRKKKRSIIFELHSIPIKLRSLWTNIHNSIPHKKCISNKRLYLVSYSIPLSCMVVLLLGSVVFVNPSLFVNDKSYAVEVNANRPSAILNAEFDMQADEPDLSPAATSLSIVNGAAADEVVAVAPGTTGYRSHTVAVNVSNAKSYALSIAGPANMTPPDKAEIQITGSGTVLGSEMAENRWGYSWGTIEADIDDLDDGDRLYHSVTSTGSALTDLPDLSDGMVSFTRKLVFAAKFSAQAVTGNYTAPVTLSLAITPNEVGEYWRNSSGGETAVASGTKSMQGIGEGFCRGNSSVLTGWTISLKDERETNKSYTIVKLRDGNCWMQENLTLTGPKTLTSGDTDNPLDGNWYLPASVTSWSMNDASVVQIRTGSTNIANWRQGYGNYYSWCAATAGTCGTAKGAGMVASGSVCPRNWHLPTGGDNGEYYKMSNGLNMTSVTAAPYLFVASGGIFPANSNGLSYTGDAANYWSGTSKTESNAYDFRFNKTEFNPGNYNTAKYVGEPVRCIADY